MNKIIISLLIVCSFCIVVNSQAGPDDFLDVINSYTVSQVCFLKTFLNIFYYFLYLLLLFFKYIYLLKYFQNQMDAAAAAALFSPYGIANAPYGINKKLILKN